MHFTASNTNQLAPIVYQAFKDHGVVQQSRNGPVRRLPGLTTITLTNPVQRVNFCPARDANPFFHVFEAMAMLANFNDASLLACFAKNMLSFVDPGMNHFNAFYGTRMHRRNQLLNVIEILRNDPQSRRCFVDLWDIEDLSKETKDMACNLGMVFEIGECGSVNMTTFNRSNDAIWGHVSGANIVHFSFFQEFVARALQRPVGTWSHASANLHVYTEMPGNPWERVSELPDGEVFDYVPDMSSLDLFTTDQVAFTSSLSDFMCALQAFLLGGDTHEATLMRKRRWSGQPFIETILQPMAVAWKFYKGGLSKRVICDVLKDNMPPGNDWRIASIEWVMRRKSIK